MADSRSVSSGTFSNTGSSVMPKKSKPSTRLTNKKSLIMSSMPFFLQGLQKEPNQVKKGQNFNTKSPEENSPVMHGPSESFNQLQNERNKAKDPLKKRLDYPESDENERSFFLEQIDFFDRIVTEDREKQVLKFSHLNLTVQELIDFKDNKEISRNFIDYCLGIFQKINKDLLVQDKNCSKVLLSSTSFAWKIFNQESFKNIHFHDFCFEFANIIFPIYVGYWSLLVIWREEHKVFYYQVGDRGNLYLKSILINCYKFLNQEFIHFNNKDIMKNLNTISYEKTNNNSQFNENQSGLFILMITKLYCTTLNPHHFELSRVIQDIEVDTFKHELIDLILKESERNL